MSTDKVCEAVEIPYPTCPMCSISLRTRSKKFQFICPGIRTSKL